MQLIIYRPLSENPNQKYVRITIQGNETIGWLLYRIHQIRISEYKLQHNTTDYPVTVDELRAYILYCYVHNNGCKVQINLADSKYLKTEIRNYYDEGSYVQLIVSGRALLYTAANPQNKAQLVEEEYSRVESRLANPIIINTLRNITLGFIKKNPELLQKTKELCHDLHNSLENTTDESSKLVIGLNH